MSNDIPSTCTVVVDHTGARCGKPSVAFWKNSRDELFLECADHYVAVGTAEVAHQAPTHPPTRTSKPFVLVADGVIVGYADSDGPAVRKRADRLGAAIVRVVR